MATKAVVKELVGPPLSAAVGLIFGGNEPIEPVSYQVSVEGGPDLDWHVRRFQLTEAISEPYEMSLDLMTEDTRSIDFVDELLGADLALEYGRNGSYRKISGVIERVDTVGVDDGRLTVRVKVVPALKLLSQRVDTRIFQDMKVPDILKEVLGSALDEYGRAVDVSKLNDTYLMRDYCVQFKESDLHFSHRLMEEEGISYYFDPDEDGGMEKLVLVDQEPAKPNEDFPEVESVFDEYVPIITSRHETATSESIQYLEWSRPEQVTKVTTRQFNWKQPDVGSPPESEKETEDETRGRVREIYIPDDRRRIEDQGGDDGYTGTAVDEDEKPHNDKRFEMMLAGRSQGQGSSNITGLRAGGRFDIDDHPHPEVALSKLLITRVVHFGDCADQQLGAAASGARYQNSFECMPAVKTFRPLAAALKPVVHGPQTAIVTGPEGEEIHTDSHGRIKVKFHWDRLSPQDQTSSCWVRVAQMWAGPGWGTWFLPRIGMEVVVVFLDGNPDRPLVVGCVYNGQNKPPYPLPDKKTMSTIKSDSSIGGGGFNEFRFEDMKGCEQVFLHAQKDLLEKVRNNRTRSVGANETLSVMMNRMRSVGGNETVSVMMNRGHTVGMNESIFVGGNRVVCVSGGSNMSIGSIPPPPPGQPPPEPNAGEYKIEIENKIELKCGASSLTMDKAGVIELKGTDIKVESSGPIAETAGGEMTLIGSLIKLNP
ncbi:MAG: type VI secretion system tip protein TssI/VgrG [Myxococcota bacterium]